MNGGNFVFGLEHMAQWIANLVLPVIAAYCVIAALLAIHNRRDGVRYLFAGLMCLMGPALADLAYAFLTNVPAVGGHDPMYNALLNAINWIGNVIMPMFSAYNVACGVIVLSGFGERLYVGEDWMRYFIVALGGLMVSGIMRLLEWFVVQGQTTTISGSFSSVSSFVVGGHIPWR